MNKNPKKILYAEDYPTLRNAFSRFLRECGYDVTAVEDGVQLINALKNPDNKFSLIITDGEMPNMSGEEATRIIRNEMGSVIPIVAYTASEPWDGISCFWKKGKIELEDIVDSLNDFFAKEKKVSDGPELSLF